MGPPALRACTTNPTHQQGKETAMFDPAEISRYQAEKAAGVYDNPDTEEMEDPRAPESWHEIEEWGACATL